MESEAQRPASRRRQSDVLPKSLRRLLSDLEHEVVSLSLDNVALQREICEVRSSKGGQAQTPKSPNRSNGLRKSPPADRFFEVADPDGLAGGYFAGNPGGPRTSLKPVPARPSRQLETPEPEQAGVRSPREVQLALNTQFTRETLAAGHREAGNSTSRFQWQQQFDRLRKESENLSSYDLWVVVSRQEHMFYGHSKHPLRTVMKTVQLIREFYNNAPFPEGFLRSRSLGAFHSSVGKSVLLRQENLESEDDSHTSDGGSVRTDTPPSETALDWETFMAFMADDNCRISEEEGGNAEYLRKALRAESNEYFTEEARKEIAQRQEDEADPSPAGWRKVILEELPPPVIMVNALCLGLQSDMDSPVFDVLELFFLSFYLLEISVKAHWLGCRRFFRGNDAPWNIFDLACIVVSLTDLVFYALHIFFRSTWGAQDPNAVDTPNLDILKFFRLARFTRLARIIKSFKSHYFDDLKTMSLGILSGAKVLLWAVVLFFACVFVLGVLTKELMGDQPGAEEFRNVPSAMFSVFRCLTEDCSTYRGTPLHEKMRQRYGAAVMIPYILTYLVMNFGLFNLIVAVFIDRVVSISVKAKQQDLGKREREMRAAIEEMLVSLTRGFTEQSKSSCRPRLSTGSVLGSNIRSRFSYNRAKQLEADEARHRATADAMQQLRAEKLQITRELFSTWLTDPEVLEFLENLEIDTSTKMEIFDVCDVDKSGSLTCDELVNGLMRLRGPISKCDVIAIRLKVRYLTKILEDIHHMTAA